MAFEKFIGGGRGRQCGFIISINQGGAMYINSNTLAKYFKDFKFVTFYYDRERRIIGLKPEKRAGQGAYPLRKIKRGGAFLSCRGFLDCFDLSFGKTTRLELCWNEKDGLVELRVKNFEKK
jgi:hypothetical protein